MDRIPLGSVLGPLLFILYINDITDDIQSLSRLFGDDTLLSYSFSNINEIEQRIISDRITIYNWSTKWLYLLIVIHNKLNEYYSQQIREILNLKYFSILKILNL